MLKKLMFPLLLVLISACKPVGESNAISTKVALKPQCLKSQSQCEIKTALTNYHVKFSQQLPQGELIGEIKTELPFYIELSANGPTAAQSLAPEQLAVSAYLEGKDMFMGKVPIYFEQQNEGNVYVAQSLLASCSEKQMVWRLWITAGTSDNTETFFIDFTSQRL